MSQTDQVADLTHVLETLEAMAQGAHETSALAAFFVDTQALIRSLADELWETANTLTTVSAQRDRMADQLQDVYRELETATRR